MYCCNVSVLNIGLLFSSHISVTLVSMLYHLSILYTNKFLVRECFYLLVSLVFSSGVFISGHKLILIFEGREGGLKF